MNNPLGGFFRIPSASRDVVTGLLSAGNPLAALEVVLPTIGIPCTMCGELGTILTFSNAPLSYSLRITKDRCTSIVRMIKDLESVSHEREIRSEVDLQSLCSEILAFLTERECEKKSGSFRPVPVQNAKLLDMLECRNGLFGHERFREASRMVARGHLLDAVVEVATPFGLQPERIDGSFVRFHSAGLKQGEMPGLRIYRFGKFGSEMPAPFYDEKGVMPLDLGKCVVMGFVKVQDAEQRKADEARQLGPMLRRGGFVKDLDDEDFSTKSLLYDLSKPEDILAMMERILLMRDTQRALKMPFEMGKWLGKQKNQAEVLENYPDPISRPRAYACWLRQNGDGGSQVTYGAMTRPLEIPLRESLRRTVLVREQIKVDAISTAETEEKDRKGEKHVC